MVSAFALGPLLVPVLPGVIVLSLLSAVWAAGHLGRRLELDVGWLRGTAEGAAWVGLVGARLGYVAAHWSAFRAEPWTALYFWQPGYFPYVGILLGAAYGIGRLSRKPTADRFVYARAFSTGYGVGALVFGTMIVGAHALAPANMLRSGDRVPDFTLVDLSGNPVRFSDQAGRGVILNFWATWCPPCRREMPLLDAIQAEYGPRGLTVVGIDLDEPADIVTAFIVAMDVRYPIWLDPLPTTHDTDRTRSIYERFGGVGLPTTAFIDRTGMLRRTHVGELNRAIVQEYAESILRQ